ncbi:MAG: M48 family metalloprotease [Mariprofundales bacterium]
MHWLEYFFVVVVLLSTMLVGYWLLAWYRVRYHRCVQPLAQAIPEVAGEIQFLAKRIALIAGVPLPQLFVRRAALPNAFVLATIARPELYLTDELFESLDEQPDSLDQLTKVLCHEIAHIRLNHAVTIGLWTIVQMAGNSLGIALFESWACQKIAQLEVAADQYANQIFTRMMFEDDGLLKSNCA